MAQGPQFYLLKSFAFLPASDADSLLGYIVRSYTSPGGDKRPQTGDLPRYLQKPILYRDTEILECKASATSVKGGEVGVGLESLVECKFGRRASDELHIDEAKRIWYRRMEQDEDRFEELMSHASIQQKLRKWARSRLRSESACMIVGLLMCDDAVVSEVRRATHSVDTKGTIPVVTIVSSVHGLPSLDVGNPSGHVSRTSSQTTTISGRHDSSKIIGIEYRWVYKSIIAKGAFLHERGPSSSYQLSSNTRQISAQDDSSEEDDDSDDDPEADDGSHADEPVNLGLSNGTFLDAFAKRGLLAQLVK
ncbi:hypothetical protein MMC25_008059 [Agyrium rufum]|nr:hypothetical protein [Agyrium rufum]